MIEKVKRYLDEKGLKVDDNLLKYIENGIEISENDEYKHDFGSFPPHHNESWYFNFIDRPNNVFLITRWSFEMYDRRSLVMFVLIVDGKITTYFQDISVDSMLDNWEFDKRVKYYCIKPMQQWRVTFEDKKVKMDITFNARFPVFNYLSGEYPIDAIEEYGIELLDVAAQQHYEQGMKATGTLLLKKTDETRRINCLGHRDHSWGTRDWVGIDRWYWISAQFEDKTVNITRVEFRGKITHNGFISSKDGNIVIKKIEVTTETKDDGKTPLTSTFILTDENGNKHTIISHTIFTLHFPVPVKEGFTEVFEQITTFKFEGKEGDGIAEYLISTRQ
ncbi:MAG: hypothetical protein HWN66_02115 [Candidatus Helarchaeota archaeon]|nr:hypothetical protein [Candidatus Helarchaeota archaeon]